MVAYSAGNARDKKGIDISFGSVLHLLAHTGSNTDE